MAWELNAVYDLALDQLNLTKNIIVWDAQTIDDDDDGNPKSKTGLYVWDDNKHNVYILSHLDHKWASRILWHELCHAVQQEARLRDKEYNIRYMYHKNNTEYANRPSEIEARTWETMAETMPLTRKPRRIPAKLFWLTFGLMKRAVT